MLITFMNKKGGVGKTSLAFNVAKDLDYFLISNDDSVIEDIYPNKAKIQPNIELYEENIVYDLGGFIDVNSIKIIRHSNIVFIPTLLDINSIKRTVNTIHEIQDITTEIIIIINGITNKDLKKYHQAKEILEKLGKEIIIIPKSESIPNSMYLGKTITEQYNQNKLSQNSFKGIYSQYKKILEKIKG